MCVWGVVYVSTVWGGGICEHSVGGGICKHSVCGKELVHVSTMCVCRGTGTCEHLVMTHIWRLQESFVESVLSLHLYVGSRD